MKLLTPLKLAVLVPFGLTLAGCEMPGRDDDGRLRDISPAAMAALPPGVDPALLVRDENGCYGLGIEETDPPSGVALLDAQGMPICDA